MHIDLFFFVAFRFSIFQYLTNDEVRLADCSCERAEQIVVEYDEPFSFNCKLDESIYFG